MASREITKLRDDLLWLLRHAVEALDGLEEDEINWRPPAKDANSLIVLATHTLGAAEAHVLQLLAGQVIDRVRASEFAVSGSAEPVRARLRDVTQRITAVLDALDPAELERERPSPGGSSTGREVLLWALTHASQHLGAAQLTRDLVLAARTAHTGAREDRGMGEATTKDLTPEGVARLIEASGAFVAAELRALGPDAAFHPAPGEWCAKEVAGHLIEAERRGFAGRIRQFLEADGPNAIAWDQEAVERERQDCKRDPVALANELQTLRRESLVLVRSLRPDQLTRWGTHPKVGRLTINDLLHEWVHHDRNHARQLMAATQDRVYPHLGGSQGFVGE